VPSAGDGPGTPGNPGTGPGPLPSSTPAPAPAPTIGPHPPPTPACTDCLATTVSWGPSGGLTSYTTTSSLKACRTYDHSRVTGNEAPTLICTANLSACGAPSIAVADVEAALADPDVIAALAGTTKTYGSDFRPCDGAVESITVGANTIEVGGDCTGPNSGCTQMPCVPVPPGLRALANVLDDLDKQEATAHPECTGN
jgi:hypothetical protein